MKRNTKFLLVLAFALSAILGTYFLSGCSEDSTTVEDQGVGRNVVIGSVQGVVRSAYDNDQLDSVKIWWVKTDGDVEDTTHYVITNDLGYFLIDDELTTGDYILTFEYIGSGYGYAVETRNAHIPTIADLVEDVDAISGDLSYMVSMGVSCEGECDEVDAVMFWPLASTITGYLYTGDVLCDGEVDASRESSEGAIQDDSLLISPAGNVRVELIYGASECADDIHAFTYVTTTDEYTGQFTFADVPFVRCEVLVRTMAFTPDNDTSYALQERWVSPEYAETVRMDNIYACITCAGGLPVVMDKNFSDSRYFGYEQSLNLTFSHEMDTLDAALRVELYEGENLIATTLTWSTSNTDLTIDPIMTLKTDTEYDLYLEAQSVGGCPLNANYQNFTFTVEDGIDLVSTNIERAPGWFDRFPINETIYLYFNMAPYMIAEQGDDVKLEDITSVDSVNWLNPAVAGYRVDVDSATQTTTPYYVSIDPDNPLELSHVYRLTYEVYSEIPADFDYAVMWFKTELDTLAPGVCTGWASNQPTGWRADWNTTTHLFKWNINDRAKGYKIYAKDNMNNTDFVEIGDFDQEDFVLIMTNTATLPAQFDLYADDGIQTPYSGGTQISYDIRAYNDGGLGPFTGTPITVADLTPPTVWQSGGAFAWTQTYGGGDNTTGDYDSVAFGFNGATLEYLDRGTSNPGFAFVEAGGNEAYTLPTTQITWNWNNDVRTIDYGFAIIPDGSCAAGDSLVITLTDNSGNDTTFAFRVAPYIDFDCPTADSTNIEAPSYPVKWTTTEAPGVTAIANLDRLLWYGGAAVDSVEGYWDPGTTVADPAGTNTYTWPLPDDMHDPAARFGFRDATGGVIWWSEVFVYSGINMTGPDSLIYSDSADTHVYDAMGYDSTGLPITWTQDGLDSVGIWYFKDATIWVIHDTVTPASGGAYTFYPPDLGEDWLCSLRVADLDIDNRPHDGTVWDFLVLHDTLEVITPATGVTLVGGANYDIEWDLFPGVDDHSATTLKIEYSTNSGTDWTVIAAATPNDSLLTWVVPAAEPADNTALLRVINSDDTDTLFTTGLFTISGLTITAPTTTDEWLVGSTQTVSWTCTNPGLVGPINLYYFPDITVKDSTLIQAGIGNGATVNYSWAPVNAPPDSTVWLRAWGTTQDVYADAGPFIVAGVTITSPNGGDYWYVGGAATIDWTWVGDIPTVDVAYSINNGANWTDIHVTGLVNTGTWIWPDVANSPSELCIVRVRDHTTGFGSDGSDAVFTISGVEVTSPNGGQTWTNGETHAITWNEVGIVDTVKLEYSLLAGATGTWNDIPGAEQIAPASGGVGLGTYTWVMQAIDDPNFDTADGTALIRVSEINGTITDQSDAAFTIANAAPVIGGVAATYTVAEGAALPTITVTGTDADAGTKLTLSASGVPAGAVWAGATGTTPISATFDWTPAVGDAAGGPYTVIFTLSDGMETFNVTFTTVITVTP